MSDEDEGAKQETTITEESYFNKSGGIDREKGYKSRATFKGKTPGMHGNLFEVLGEKGIKNQFKDSLEALERYAGETYPKEITLLQPIFKRLERPNLEPPTPPKKTKPKAAKAKSKAKTEMIKFEEAGDGGVEMKGGDEEDEEDESTDDSKDSGDESDDEEAME